MPKLISTKRKSYYSEDLFLLQVNHGLKQTGIKMKVFTPNLTTLTLPDTHSTLEKLLPSILSSKCFNEKNLPFGEEVKNTELGHLFEHILLEYLTKVKHLYQNKMVSFSGITSWDWSEDEKGIFYIKVNAGIKDALIFEEALNMSIKLLTQIVKIHALKIN